MRTAITLIVAAGALLALPAKTEWKTLTPSKSKDKVKIIVKDKAIPYYRLNAESPLEAAVKGPVRLRIYVRCELPKGTAAPVPYAFATSLDGGAPQPHSAAAVASQVAKFDGAGSAIPGDPDNFYVEVPEGDHAVSVTVDKTCTQSLDVRFYLPKKPTAEGPKEPGK